MPYETTINFSEQQTSTLVENLTYVTPSGFRLIIDSQKYPNAQYTVQTIALPDMSVSAAPFNTPKRNIGMTPDKVEYAPMDLTFLVDEDMKNYKEIHDWILGLVTEDDNGVRKQRDITLQILNSHANVSNEITFVDAFPITLSSLPFDAGSTTADYLTAAVTFQYSYFRFKN